MLRRRAKLFRIVMMLVDLYVVGASFFFAYLFVYGVVEMGAVAFHLKVLAVALASWITALAYLGFYFSFRAKRIVKIIVTIAEATVLGLLIFASAIYLLGMEGVGRPFIVAFFALTFFALCAERISLLLALRLLRNVGYDYKMILVVGTGRRAQHFIDLAARHREWGFRVVGLVDKDPARTGQVIRGHRVIGSFADIPAIIADNVIDEVVFVIPRSWLDKIEEVMHFCELQGLRVSVAVDYFELKFSRARQADFEGMPILTFESAPPKTVQMFLKRFLDITVSATLLVALAPVYLAAAGAIALACDGPVFFRQKRCSVNGRRFVLYKFRTMVIDAEARRKDLIGHNEMSGPVFKITNDPRLTRTGAFLRKFSIDELPQLWNVLKGDMSLVGPRPLPISENKYEPWQRRRLSVKPGLTCLWQVSGRNRIKDFNEWVKLDLAYIDNWSLLLDIKILFKTIPSVLFGVGAK